MKNQYIGGLSKKGGAWTICRFKVGAWQERGVVFSKGEGGGVDTPMHTMGSFLGICTMFFSKTLRGVRFPY